MAWFYFDIVNNENKLATLLESHSSLIKKFVPQSGNVATDATVDVLVIEFDQVKYEEFLHYSNSITLSKTD